MGHMFWGHGGKAWGAGEGPSLIVARLQQCYRDASMWFACINVAQQPQ